MFAPRFLTLFPLLLLAVAPADAFVREYNRDLAGNPTVPLEWIKNQTVLMHLSLSPGLNDAAEDALNLWNQQLVHMRFAVDKGSILTPSETDANTSVIMTGTIYGEQFGDGVLAVTLVTPREPGNEFRLVEADVVFNASYNWGVYSGPLQPDFMDFHRVALHEFGHVVGLNHPDQAKPKQNVLAIMNSTISYVDSLQTDDINGAHSIYDSGPAYLAANPAPNLVNLSTRAFVGLGENAVIGGFIIQGSQPATVVLRGIGNSLGALGIKDALEDVFIELHSASGATLATSDDWTADSWATTVASYHLDPSNTRESAIVATLNPGSYTIIVRSFDNGDGHLTGTALVELYDLHTTGGRAGNISTRGQVQNGDQILIGGFIVGGTESKTVVVRAVGPSLTAAGIAHPLSDPTVELHDASGTTLASNDDWDSGPNAAQIQSEGLAPTQSSESALQATLNPGSYTAIVRGANGATGVGLVEIYDLSPAP